MANPHAKIKAVKKKKVRPEEASSKYKCINVTLQFALASYVGNIFITFQLIQNFLSVEYNF